MQARQQNREAWQTSGLALDLQNTSHRGKMAVPSFHSSTRSQQGNAGTQAAEHIMLWDQREHNRLLPVRPGVPLSQRRQTCSAGKHPGSETAVSLPPAEEGGKNVHHTLSLEQQHSTA